MNYITGHEFYLETSGKKIDVDNRYGNQCVDLFKYFLGKIGYPNHTRAIGGTGYADELWKRKDALGYNTYFDYITDIYKLQDGDWCLWAFGSKTCPSSHVAMFRKDNGNGTGTFLGQNQGGHLEAVDQRNFSYNGIVGALRLKKLSKIAYNGHVENFGWTAPMGDGGTCGTVGKSLRLEAIHIDTRLSDLDMTVKAHIQNEGWKDYGKINNETIIGTVGKAEALECLCLNCTNANVEYRVHIQNVGWSGWTKADGIATLGTVGQALQLETIEMRVK